MINETLEFIKENKDLLFGGAGVTVAVAIVNFFRNKNKEQDTPQKNQSASNNAVNIQGHGNISVGSINTAGHKIPENIAKPDFSLKQISFTGVAGRDPEYGFDLYNGGGDCFSVEVISDSFSQSFKFPKIPRGGRTSFRTKIPGGTDYLEIRIKGFDGNGAAYAQYISSPKYLDGFKFT